MKKERNARKTLNDLYLYLDVSDGIRPNEMTDAKKQRYEEVKEKYDKEFKRRHGCAYEWFEYYGLFTLGNGKIGIDPKRMRKKTRIIDDCMYQVMSKRKTTYFHPKKNEKNDYCVNRFVEEIDDIKKDFDETYKPIINRSVKAIKMMKSLCPGDYDLLAQGISGANSASIWARMQNAKNEAYINYKKTELYNSQYAQFIQTMASRIEAVTASVWRDLNPGAEDWRRDRLYDNISVDGTSSRNLPSLKYHDRLYCIWNFLKHNNISTYNKLKKNYPEDLIEEEYKSGDLAIHYLVGLGDKLVYELLEGTKRFFIEWCKKNLNEDYEEAQWNYSSYFTDHVNDDIELMRNPLGLEWWDDMD